MIVGPTPNAVKYNDHLCVLLSPSLGVPGGACIVKRKLPERDGEFEHRVKMRASGGPNVGPKA
jgi:hypothetical protein